MDKQRHKRLKLEKVVAATLALTLHVGESTSLASEGPKEPTAICTGEFYAVRGLHGELVRIDRSVSPFVIDSIGTTGAKLDNLGFRRTDGFFYAVELVSGGNNGLIQIDADANVTQLGHVSGLPNNVRFEAGDIPPDGNKMYLTTATTNNLYILDLTSLPALAPVSSVPISGGSGLVFDWAWSPTDEMLYGGDNEGQLARLDPTTGIRTDLEVDGCSPITADCYFTSLPAGNTYTAAWFNAAGRLFLYRTSGIIFEIDTGSREIMSTQTGPSSSRFDGASCQQSTIGAAKQMTSTTKGGPLATITIDYVFENFSLVEDLSNLSAIDDLSSAFGVHGIDWMFTSISSVPPAFANPAFDGHTALELINQGPPTQSLLAASTATIMVTLKLLTLQELNSCGEYCNQIMVTGETPGGLLVGDLSTEGLDPDPSNDGHPFEDEVSCFRPSVGDNCDLQIGFSSHYSNGCHVDIFPKYGRIDSSGRTSPGQYVFFTYHQNRCTNGDEERFKITCSDGSMSIVQPLTNGASKGYGWKHVLVTDISQSYAVNFDPMTCIDGTLNSCNSTPINSLIFQSSVLTDSCEVAVQYSPATDSPQTVGMPVNCEPIACKNFKKAGNLNLGDDDAITPGDIIDYTFEVTNTGDVTLTNINISDPLTEPITCPSGNPIPTLTLGASEICTGSYAITPDDIAAGQVINTATAVSNETNPVMATHIQPLAIFTDGFESGDTSRWSSTVP